MREKLGKSVNVAWTREIITECGSRYRATEVKIYHRLDTWMSRTFHFVAIIRSKRPPSEIAHVAAVDLLGRVRFLVLEPRLCNTYQYPCPAPRHASFTPTRTHFYHKRSYERLPAFAPSHACARLRPYLVRFLRCLRCNALLLHHTACSQLVPEPRQRRLPILPLAAMFAGCDDEPCRSVGQPNCGLHLVLVLPAWATGSVELNITFCCQRFHRYRRRIVRGRPVGPLDHGPLAR